MAVLPQDNEFRRCESHSHGSLVAILVAQKLLTHKDWPELILVIFCGCIVVSIGSRPIPSTTCCVLHVMRIDDPFTEHLHAAADAHD